MQLKIKYRPLEDVAILDKNFKRHALGETEQSIIKRGFIDPIGVNPNTGNAFDGNGRIEVSKSMYQKWLVDKTQPVPVGVTVQKNKWLVPAVDVAMTPDEEVAAAAALNQINKLGGYDEAFQLEILQEMQDKGTFEATGFTDADLQDLLKRFPPDKPPTNGIPEMPASLSGAPDNDIELEGEPGDRPQSNIKQVALLYNIERHKEFVSLTVALASKLGTDNQTDTVLAALRYANENLSPKTDTVE